MPARLRPADIMARAEMVTEAAAALRVVKSSAESLQLGLQFATSAHRRGERPNAPVAEVGDMLRLSADASFAIDFLHKSGEELQRMLDPRGALDAGTVELGTRLKESLAGLEKRMGSVRLGVQSLDEPGNSDGPVEAGRLLGTLEGIIESTIPALERDIDNAREAYRVVVLGEHSGHTL